MPYLIIIPSFGISSPSSRTRRKVPGIKPGTNLQALGDFCILNFTDIARILVLFFIPVN
jgi:hypothetical protein